MTATLAEVDCPGWCQRQHPAPEPFGEEYHRAKVADLVLTGMGLDGEIPRATAVVLHRFDDDGVTGAVSVDLEVNLEPGSEVVEMTPAEALNLADQLLKAAFAAAGVLDLPVLAVRIGDEIETSDGWQIVESILINTVGPMVELFTVEQYSSDVGWSYAPAATVRVRREVSL